MTRPACDGQYITIVGSATDPSRYFDTVAGMLGDYPSAAYLRTGETCPSLRATTNAGDPIYSIYFGPFPTAAEACAARVFGPADAYVRTLSTSVPSTHVVDC